VKKHGVFLLYKPLYRFVNNGGRGHARVAEAEIENVFFPYFRFSLFSVFKYFAYCRAFFAERKHLFRNHNTTPESNLKSKIKNAEYLFFTVFCQIKTNTAKKPKAFCGTIQYQKSKLCVIQPALR
jgi:hypothetical protein